ncbi:hypothetical protein IEQ34_016950 [Dendrobium chrysotoxum]|uniref:Uncharacterized protein n=1 Tax=Dendrobium chrysotoxum TaxID=161865 RepID=A0AAV7GEU9_DENCH|nr:hypothetical protein IEQ34_016950 [Dendrobium chrysotoxum]
MWIYYFILILSVLLTNLSGPQVHLECESAQDQGIVLDVLRGLWDDISIATQLKLIIPKDRIIVQDDLYKILPLIIQSKGWIRAGGLHTNLICPLERRLPSVVFLLDGERELVLLRMISQLLSNDRYRKRFSGKTFRSKIFKKQSMYGMIANRVCFYDIEISGRK